MWKLIISVFVGAAAALAYFVYFLQSQVGRSGEQVFVFLYLVALFSVGVYPLLIHFVLPRLRTFSRRAQVAWVIASLSTGMFLLVVTPVRLPVMSTLHHLEITATGQKNQAALGSELWVTGLFRANGTQVDSAEFTLNGDWEVRDGVPLSYRHQPAALVWQGQLDGDVQLHLLSHPWSGIVTVTWDGATQTIDLYSPTGTRKDIALPVRIEVSWQSVMIFLAGAISLGTLLLVISIWLATRPIQAKATVARRWGWVGYAAPCITIWSIYLLAFWPGLMTLDSIDQWQQMLTGQISDFHPVFHTLTNWLVTRIWLSPAMVALAQITVLSIVAGLILMQLRKWGASRLVVWLTCILFALSPANGILVNTLWKDVPYSIAVLILTYFILQMVQDHGTWLNRKFAWVWLGTIAACVALYRHNGAPVAVGTLIILFIAYRQYWKRLALASALMLGMWLGIRGSVYQLLNVQPLPSSFFTAYIALKHVAAHLAQGAELTASEQAFLQQVRTGDLKWPYLCSTAEPLLYDGKLNSDFALSHSAELTQLAIKLLQQNPKIDLDDQLCGSSLVWRLSWPPTPQHRFNVLPFTIGNDGLPYTWKAPQGPKDPLDYTPYRIESPIPTVSQFLIQNIRQMLQPDNISWLWRPALYFYILVAASAIAAIRSRYWKFLLLCIPVVLNSLVLVMTLAQDFRYEYSVVLAGLLFSFYLIFSVPLADHLPDRQYTVDPKAFS